MDVLNAMAILPVMVSERCGMQYIVKETKQAVAAYYGGDQLAEYIPKFSTQEDDVKHQWRQSTSIESYDNYPEEILQQYIEGLSKAGTITRKTKNSDFDNKLEKEYASWFESELMPMALLLPECYVRICLPPSETKNIRTRADKEKEELYPYPVLVFPQHIQNFECDRHNNLKWISVRVGPSEFDVFDATNVTRVKVKEGGTELEVVTPAQPHGFKQVPFVRIMWREYKAEEGSPKPGRAFMYNIIKKSISAIRYVSMQAEIIHFHAFPKLVMDTLTIKNIEKQGGIGINTPIPESPNPQGGGGEGATRYLTMPDTELKAVMDIIERTRKAIYRAARLRDRTTDTVNPQSGISKAFDLIPEVSVLSDLCKYLFRYDKQIVTIMANAWLEKEVEPDIKYPVSFDVKSTAEVQMEVSTSMEAMSSASLPQSETANKLLSKKIYKGLLPDLSPDQQKKVDDEIEAEKKPEPKPKVPIISGIDLPAPLPVEDEE